MGLALKLVLSNLIMTDSIGRQTLLNSVAEDDGEYEGVDPAVSRGLPKAIVGCRILDFKVKTLHCGHLKLK